MARNRTPKTSRSNSGQLRVIAGNWRGRKLSFPALEGLRPTGDRMRETLFNWLQDDIHDARCLDLFAGSGSLGLEALSRGAQHCTFIDTQAQACQALRANLALLNCQQAHIEQRDALSWLDSQSGINSEPFNIVFCDPPFALDLWAQTLTKLTNHSLLAKDALIYLESPRKVAIATAPSWHLQRSKETGQVRFCLFQAAG